MLFYVIMNSSINKNLMARIFLNQHNMLFLLFRFSLAGGIIKSQ